MMVLHQPEPEESTVPATYTFEVFSTLDGFGSPGGGDWGGYWGKQGPDLLEHRLASLAEEQRLVFGGNTYRLVAHFGETLDANPEDAGRQHQGARLRAHPPRRGTVGRRLVRPASR
jgi:hypothetical protein